MNSQSKSNAPSSSGTDQCQLTQDYGSQRDRSQGEVDPCIKLDQHPIMPQVSHNIQDSGLFPDTSAFVSHGSVPKVPTYPFSGGLLWNGREHMPPLPPYPHRIMPYINNGHTNYFELNLHPHLPGNATNKAIDPEIRSRRFSDRGNHLVDNMQASNSRSLTGFKFDFNQEQHEQEAFNPQVLHRRNINQFDVSRMQFTPTPNAHLVRSNPLSHPNRNVRAQEPPELTHGAEESFQEITVGNYAQTQPFFPINGGMAMMGNYMTSGGALRPKNMLPSTPMSYTTYEGAFKPTPRRDTKVLIETETTSSATWKKNPVTGLFFESLLFATAAFPAPDWHYPQPDHSIPTTLEETMAIVIQIRDAMLNIDGIYDKGTSPVLQNRWMSNSNFYGEARVEKVAWEMTDLMIRLHIEGPKILNIDDPAAVQKAQKEKNLTFQARLDKVVYVLHHYKARCDHVMGGEGPRKALIMAPTQIGANCSANRINNDHRQGRLKKSRELEEKGGSKNNGKRKYTRKTKQTYTASTSNASGFPFSPILGSSPGRSDKSASLSVHDRCEIPTEESGTLRGSGNISEYINSPENEPDDQPPPQADDEFIGGMSSIHDEFLRTSRIRPDSGKSSNFPPATDLGSSTRYQTRGSIRNSAGQLNSTKPTNKRRREETKDEQNEAPVMKRGRGRPRKSR